MAKVNPTEVKLEAVKQNGFAIVSTFRQWKFNEEDFKDKILAASMGPLPFGNGSKDPSKEVQLEAVASMGPLPFGNGSMRFY